MKFISYLLGILLVCSGLFCVPIIAMEGREEEETTEKGASEGTKPSASVSESVAFIAREAMKAEVIKQVSRALTKAKNEIEEQINVLKTKQKSDSENFTQKDLDSLNNLEGQMKGLGVADTVNGTYMTLFKNMIEGEKKLIQAVAPEKSKFWVPFEYALFAMGVNDFLKRIGNFVYSTNLGKQVSDKVDSILTDAFGYMPSREVIQKVLTSPIVTIQDHKKLAAIGTAAIIAATGAGYLATTPKGTTESRYQQLRRWAGSKYQATKARAGAAKSWLGSKFSGK